MRTQPTGYLRAAASPVALVMGAMLFAAPVQAQVQPQETPSEDATDRKSVV